MYRVAHAGFCPSTVPIFIRHTSHSKSQTLQGKDIYNVILDFKGLLSESVEDLRIEMIQMIVLGDVTLHRLM